MKTRKIAVTVKRTIQTASYESSSVEITEEVELSDKDDATECRNEAYKRVTKMVKKAIDNEFLKYIDSQAERETQKKKRK